MWGALATTIVAFLADAMKGMVGRVLVALGIGAVTATGLHVAIGAALNQITGALGATGVLYPTMEAMGVVWFISTILSAITTRLTLQGLTSDAVSFWVLRRGIA